jgi:hypothetical protein
MNNSAESSSSHRSDEKDPFVSQDPLSFMPPNYSQGNKRYFHDLETRKSIQNRLNSIYYTTSPAATESSTSMNLAALTRQHMTRASLISNSGSTSSMMANAKTVKLAYSIHDHSSHSGSYHPQNICVNLPTQQASRWSSGLHDHEQYITIKFDTPVVARK